MMWFPDGAAPAWAIAWMVGMSVFMLAFWAAVIWLVYLAIKSLSGRSGPPPTSPEDIARRRFAAGEIDESTLDSILTKLRRE